MNKLFLKINYLTEKLHLIVYQITIVFTLLFYVVLKGATGHKFIISNEEILYSLLLFSAFILCGFYKEKERFGENFNKVILYLLLVLSIITFGMALYFLLLTFTFDYGFNEEVIFILLVFFLLPIIFTWCNFYLIKKVIKELRE